MKNFIAIAAGVALFFAGAWAQDKHGVRGKTKEYLNKAKDYATGFLKKEKSVAEEVAEEVEEVVEEVKKEADGATE